MGHPTINCEKARHISEQKRSCAPVSPENVAALDAHLAHCANCKVDESLKALLDSDTDEPLDELAIHRQIDFAIAHGRKRPVQRTSSQTVARHPSRRPFQIIVSLAALLVAAVAVWAVQHFFVASATPDSPEKPATSLAVATPSATLRPLQPGDTPVPSATQTTADAPVVSQGEGAIRPRLALAEGISVELSEDAQINVLLKSSETVRLQLLSGKITAVVNPDIPHPFFVIDTPLGSVSVKGTIFSVDLTGPAIVEVLRGLVAVEQASQHTNIAAGTGFHLQSHTSYALPPQSVESLAAIAARIQAADSLTANHTAPLPTSTDPDSQPSAGSTRSTDTAASRANARLPLQILLQRAREYKGNRDWANALDMYEQIIQTHPKSTEALEAHVAAGNLRLKFGNAAGALEHFNHYLGQPKAPLHEEAFLGKIKSLRALGDEKSELAVMKTFVVRYPGSIHLPAIQKRIAMLELLP